MKTKAWTFMDKTKWGEGAWLSEPDKVQYTDPTTGLPCLIHRAPSGALCGYVGVTKGHPLYGVNYSECSLPTAKPRGAKPEDDQPINFGDVKLPPWPKSVMESTQRGKVCGKSWCDHRPESLLDVHGGITYSDFCGETRKNGEGICHIPGPGEAENVWWFGFDCSHSGDVSPGYDAETEKYNLGAFREGSYKDLSYVGNEIVSLAKQLKAQEKKEK